MNEAEVLKSLPTDSMYKFMVFVGIILIVMPFLGFFMTADYAATITARGMSLNQTIDAEKKVLQDKVDSLNKSLEEAEKSNEVLDEEKLDNLVKAYETEAKFINEEITQSNEMYIMRSWLDLKMKLLSCLAIASALIGGLLLLCGFNLWYSRLQKFIDIKVKLLTEDKYPEGK